MDELSGDLTLRQLEYLVAVVDLGSVSRAAALLHVTQPTVSHQLALLERRVGVALLDRVGRGVRATPAGRALAGTGREVLEVGRRGLEVARAAGASQEVLTIGVVSSLAATILPPALAAWHAEEPDVAVRLREHLRRDELVEALQRSEGEVGIAAPPTGWPGEVVPLGWERYVLVLPPGSPLLGRKRPVGLAALAEVDWVLFDADHGLHDLVQRACAEAGFSPRPAVRTRQIDTAVRLAASGLGPALVPAISVPAEHASLVAPFRPALRRPVAAFGPGLARPAVRRFLAHLTPERTGLEPP
ncbi:LysR family transcriptional regulator [Aquihabitans sp. G128]|uniref:LysR family transcriptional regulator n=1 Tax=Aquihabitans sp. G128 TaxID=2849779 RepID=UPI001C225A20|nr:LysR family transcriptional regulator [Aquihabitans sp. G128]QXC60217.1 LysR family transcriptional regulator [Aquihabitans sp. G128]